MGRRTYQTPPPDQPAGRRRRVAGWNAPPSEPPGIQVSRYCLGAMMFGAWGNRDHDESIRIIHAALDAGINFIDTADVYSGGESRGDRRQGPEGPPRRGGAGHQVRGTDERGPQPPGLVPALDHAGGGEQPPPARHRPHRPLPGPPPRPHHRHRRHPRRPVRPRPPGQGAGHRQLHLPGRADRRGPVGGRAAGPRALPLRAAAVLDLRAGHRDRRAAHLPALRDGRHPVEPARRRLAHRALPQGRPAARGRPGPSHARPVRLRAEPRTSASSTSSRSC